MTARLERLADWIRRTRRAQFYEARHMPLNASGEDMVATLGEGMTDALETLDEGDDE